MKTRVTYSYVTCDDKGVAYTSYTLSDGTCVMISRDGTLYYRYDGMTLEDILS